MPRSKKMMLLIFGVVLIVLALIGVWWFFLMHRMNPPLQQATVRVGENPPLDTETVQLDHATFTVELATTMLEQMNGLSFRPSLAPGHGMLFTFSSPGIQNFWMKDMNFPLDMIWIGGGKVLGFAENATVPAPGAQLWSLKIYSSPDGTDQVLEVPAGTVAKDGITSGDSVVISP